ncbi:MAG: Gfo/Idh/MocA family protein [Thermoflexales bacterium]
MTPASKLRAAVIGVGVGWNHIEGYQTHPNCELAAICDINPAILKERGDRFNVPESRRFTDYREVLQSSEIDAISIALPNWLHEPVALEAFAHGKHVLCEKPLAVSVESGQRMIEAARAANKTLMVCYNHRYRPEIVWLKGEIRAGDFGHIYAAKAGWLREGWIPTHGQWFTQKERAGGGALIDLGVHVLDLALWLMGYPQPVTVSGAAFAEFGPRGQKTKPRDVKPAHFDVDDMGLGFVRFANGAVLQFESAWASHREPLQDGFYVRLFGSEAGANFYTGAPNGETVVMYKLVNDQPAAIVPRLPAGVSGHRIAVHHFVDCALSGATPESPGEHGLIGLQIIDAIYRSSQEGREVSIQPSAD